MKKFNPLFTIGTVGLIVISLLHIAIALVFDAPSVHVVFFAVYATFAAFMAIGTIQTIKNQKKLIPIRVKK